jgi:hypothetical protein
MIVETKLFQSFCEECREAGTLTTDESVAEGQDSYHQSHHHSPHTPEGEDA